MCRLGTLTDPVMEGDVATYQGAAAAAPIVTLTQAMPDGSSTVLYKIPKTQEEAVAYCQTKGGTLFEPRTPELRAATLHLAKKDVMPGKHRELLLY